VLKPPFWESPDLKFDQLYCSLLEIYSCFLSQNCNFLLSYPIFISRCRWLLTLTSRYGALCSWRGIQTSAVTSGLRWQAVPDCCVFSVLRHTALIHDVWTSSVLSRQQSEGLAATYSRTRCKFSGHG